MVHVVQGSIHNKLEIYSYLIAAYGLDHVSWKKITCSGMKWIKISNNNYIEENGTRSKAC